MESQLMLNHTTCCNLSFNYRYVSFFLYIFPTFPAISSSWKSPPYMCLNSRKTGISSGHPPNLLACSTVIFVKVFWPRYRKFLGSTPTLLSLKFLFFNILYLEDLNFLRFNCCFFFAIRDFRWNWNCLSRWWILSLFFFNLPIFFNVSLS